MWKKTSLVVVFLVGSCLAQDYSSDDQAARAQHLAPNYVHAHHDPHLYDHVKAEPYNFGFQSTDEYGTVISRQEASDSNGGVRGNYAYTDSNGVFRHVDYVADEHGYRAEIRSNEPGMGSQSPANVEIYAEPPPAGVVVDRPYYPSHHHHPNPTAHARPSDAGHHHHGGRYPAASSAAPTSVNPSRQVRPVQPSSSGIRNPSPSASSLNAANRGIPPAGTFSYVPTRHNPYPSAVAVSTSEYSQPISSYRGQNPYAPRSNYGQGVASTQQASSAVASTSSATSSQTSATGSNTGYRYPVGNPHISNFVKSDEEKVEGGSIILPSVVSAGVPTLVKHIHTYPATA